MKKIILIFATLSFVSCEKSEEVEPNETYVVISDTVYVPIEAEDAVSSGTSCKTVIEVKEFVSTYWYVIYEDGFSEEYTRRSIDLEAPRVVGQVVCGFPL